MGASLVDRLSYEGSAPIPHVESLRLPAFVVRHGTAEGACFSSTSALSLADAPVLADGRPYVC